MQISAVPPLTPCHQGCLVTKVVWQVVRTVWPPFPADGGPSGGTSPSSSMRFLGNSSVFGVLCQRNTMSPYNVIILLGLLQRGRDNSSCMVLWSYSSIWQQPYIGITLSLPSKDRDLGWPVWPISECNHWVLLKQNINFECLSQIYRFKGIWMKYASYNMPGSAFLNLICIQ